MASRAPRKTNLPDPRKPHERLTWMEFLVAQRVARGLNNTEIGRELSVHRTTVIRTINRVCVSMGLVTREDIPKYQKKHGAF